MLTLALAVALAGRPRTTWRVVIGGSAVATTMCWRGALAFTLALERGETLVTLTLSFPLALALVGVLALAFPLALVLTFPLAFPFPLPVGFLWQID